MNNLMLMRCPRTCLLILTPGQLVVKIQDSKIDTAIAGVHDKFGVPHGFVGLGV